MSHVADAREVEVQALQAVLTAINASQAVIEFSPDGVVLDANENFLKLMGYSIEEVRGRHHAQFVAPEQRDTPEYREFWRNLAAGRFQSAEFRRLGKGGREVWIQASYNPVFGSDGRVQKIVKVAFDVTDHKQAALEAAGQIAAINRSQAVIEFTPDGTILTANENFLRAMGYRLDDIRGRRHAMFVERAVADGDDYRVFWAALARGQFQSAEFKRVGNGGREVWIQASYNPILDANGKVYKVVKFASDITEQVKARQGVQATIGSVSQAVDQLNASIRDIAEVMARSRQAAQQTVESVSATGDNSAALASAAQAMAGVVDMINAITGQINLLALNATIESARAGEAGRGFAVVASEVKSLAGQARSATAKIAAEITQLRAVSDQVTAALTDIRAAINGVAGFVTSTSAAVDEQTAVTRDIAQSVQHLAREADRLVRAV